MDVFLRDLAEIVNSERAKVAEVKCMLRDAQRELRDVERHVVRELIDKGYYDFVKVDWNRIANAVYRTHKGEY